MIVVLLGPPLLAGAYFALLDVRLLVIAFCLIVGGGFLAVALACIVAMENKLNELKRNWPVTKARTLTLRNGSGMPSGTDSGRVKCGNGDEPVSIAGSRREGSQANSANGRKPD